MATEQNVTRDSGPEEAEFTGNFPGTDIRFRYSVDANAWKPFQKCLLKLPLGFQSSRLI